MCNVNINDFVPIAPSHHSHSFVNFFYLLVSISVCLLVCVWFLLMRLFMFYMQRVWIFVSLPSSLSLWMKVKWQREIYCLARKFAVIFYWSNNRSVQSADVEEKKIYTNSETVRARERLNTKHEKHFHFSFYLNTTKVIEM